MYKKAIIAVTATALVVGAGIARAQSVDGKPAWYGGIDLGRSRLGLGGGDFDNALARQGIGASSSNDRSDTSFGFNVGHLVNRNFAIEGAYTRLGDFDYSAAASSPAADTITGKYKARALSLSGVGILPLQQNWSVYGKAGLARTKTELNSSSATGALAVGNSSDSRTGLLIGAGATYDISRNVFAKAGWDRYADIGSDATGKGHADVYSVGVGYRF
ncbi:MAG TPA: porin family protein [Burkholderiales bacterium]|nr:porin family protein [Burkholderiales bacterium]